MMKTPLDDLIAETKRKRQAMEAMRRRYYKGCASYEELAEAGKAFCAAFERYHLLRFGKRKRLDFHTVIR